MKLQLFVSLVYGAFLPSDNIPWKAYKRKFIKIQFFAAQVFNCLYVNTACVIQNPLSLFLLRDRFRKIISAKNLTD